MATGNFYVQNLDSYITLGMNQYDENENFDEFETSQHYLDLKEGAREDLHALGWDDWDSYVNDSRSYPGRTFADKSISFYYCGAYIIVNIEALVRDGYYDGACYDVQGTVDVEGEKYDLFGEYSFSECHVVDDNLLGNIGLSKIHASHLVKKVEKVLENLVEEAKKAFLANCDFECVLTARFSKSECIYTKVNNNNKTA